MKMSRKRRSEEPRSSYLALDVDLQGGISGGLEEPQSFAREQSHFAVAFFKECLATVVTYESCAFIVRFEAKFFRKEA